MVGMIDHLHSDVHWMTTKTLKLATDARKPQLIEISQVANISVVS